MKRILLVLALTVLAMVVVPTLASAQVAGYEKGFFIRNEDKTFNLTLGGRVQNKLYYQTQRGSPKAISFQLRRAQLDVRSNFHDIVSTGFTLKHAVVNNTGGNFRTVDVAGAYAAVEVLPEFVVTVGMVGLPLDMITETSSSWFVMLESPVTNTADDKGYANTTDRPSFGTPDGLGINFSGSHWKWFYSLSAVNGTESNYQVNPDKKMSVGFRTGFNIMDPVPGSQTDFECSTTPKLTVSAGTMYQGRRVDDAGSNIKYLWTTSLGVGFRWRGFALTTEGYYRKTRVTSIVGGDAIWGRPRLTDIGYYAALGYYIIPKKFEIGGQGGQIIRQGPANDAWEISGGLNYYIFENNLKLQLVYDFLRDYNSSNGALENRTHNLALMASAKF